jgi:hypothetical protein
MSNEFPRRAKLYENKPQELLIRDAINEVEKMGAHPMLTDVVILLSQAKEILADYIDFQIGNTKVQ